MRPPGRGRPTWKPGPRGGRGSGTPRRSHAPLPACTCTRSRPILGYQRFQNTQFSGLEWVSDAAQSWGICGRPEGGWSHPAARHRLVPASPHVCSGHVLYGCEIGTPNSTSLSHFAYQVLPMASGGLHPGIHLSQMHLDL